MRIVVKFEMHPNQAIFHLSMSHNNRFEKPELNFLSWTVIQIRRVCQTVNKNQFKNHIELIHNIMVEQTNFIQKISIHSYTHIYLNITWAINAVSNTKAHYFNHGDNPHIWAQPYILQIIIYLFEGLHHSISARFQRLNVEI